MGDDRDELEMPLMPRRGDDGGGSAGGGDGRRASVVVTMVPRDGSAYGAATSLRLVKQPSRPPSSCSSADGRTPTDRKKSSANGGLAIKSPSKSAHSSVSGKTSAQVREAPAGVLGARNQFPGKPLHQRFLQTQRGTYTNATSNVKHFPELPLYVNWTLHKHLPFFKSDYRSNHNDIDFVRNETSVFFSILDKLKT